MEIDLKLPRKKRWSLTLDFTRFYQSKQLNSMNFRFGEH